MSVLNRGEDHRVSAQQGKRRMMAFPVSIDSTCDQFKECVC